MSEIRIAQRLPRADFLLDAQFSVPAAGITGILGRSGSGKTSLLRAIAGLEPEAKGTVQVGAQTWQDGNTKRPAHRRPVGYVFQEPGLFPHLSVRQNLEYGRKYRRLSVNTSAQASRHSAARGVALEAAIELLGLSALLARKPTTLSGGEQQRVAIARALCCSPELLLFDEPLSALDEVSKAELLPYLERVHRELQVPGFYVSHSLAELTRLADHLLILEEGRVVDCGPAVRVLTEPPAGAGFPGSANALVVADADVIDVDVATRLARVRCAGGELRLTSGVLQARQKVRLQIAARDVSIALTEPSDSSILNIVPVTIEAVSAGASGDVMLRVLYAGMPLLSSISNASLARLKLKPGDRVFAQIKAVAVLA